MLQYSILSQDDEAVITVIVPGDPNSPYVAQSDHPNFQAIVVGVTQGDESVVRLFDIAAEVEQRFQRLSERVAVKNGTVLLDGDPVHGTLQEQIIDFMEADEDFGPLVEFYEKLLTNPLGDVRDGLYTWIGGQRANGNFTITAEGDILGYKSVERATPEWRTDESVVYRPSRRGEGIVNGRDVSPEEYIEQVPGDVVEMPRSRVLHAPSQACGDGLHIGTYAYASTFYGGNTVMLVKFSPRDIVSLPDSNSTWKLRVCRYEVIEIVDEPLQVPVWSPEGVEAPVEAYGSGEYVEPGEAAEFKVGDRVIDPDGDAGVIVSGPDEDGDYQVRLDMGGTWYQAPEDLEAEATDDDDDLGFEDIYRV
jgi:hypothetical protein